MAAIQMQILMRSFVAYELTGSFAAIGIVGLASAVPMLFLSVFGGVLADRVPRKRILQAGHVLNGGFAFLIATLLLLDLLHRASSSSSSLWCRAPCSRSPSRRARRSFPRWRAGSG